VLRNRKNVWGVGPMCVREKKVSEVWVL